MYRFCTLLTELEWYHWSGDVQCIYSTTFLYRAPQQMAIRYIGIFHNRAVVDTSTLSFCPSMSIRNGQGVLLGLFQALTTVIHIWYDIKIHNAAVLEWKSAQQLNVF